MKKNEQIFILLILFVSTIGMFCITGCGKNSCEGIMLGKISEDGKELEGVSIPGCGAILTEGEGCNSACWPQSIKLVRGTKMEYYYDEPTEVSYIGCDSRYYGSGCLGCGQTENSKYIGTKKVEGNSVTIFFGSSENDEKMIAIGNGFRGCTASDINGESEIKYLEYELGIQ